MNQAPNPYAAPMVAQRETAAEAYARVPFYRQNGLLSALLLFGLVSAIVVPIVVHATSPLGAVLVGPPPTPRP